jgi:DNA-binding MarR family transcriptional regulator
MRLETLPQLACLCASLRRAARSVTQLYERELRVSVPQFTLLYVLEKQPLIQAQIAELLAIDRTTLTRTLAMLERRGLIRGAPGGDKRARRWLITGAGKRALGLSRPRWEKVQKRLRERLGEQRWELLLDELTTVAAGARYRPADGVDRVRIGKTRVPRL